MMAEQDTSLIFNFAELTDPRIDRTNLHDLLDIVAIAICAVTAGAETWDDIEDFGHAKHAWLKTFLTLTNGIPSHDTTRRLFERLDPDESSDASSAGSRPFTRRPDGMSSPSTASACVARSIGPGASPPCTWSTPGPRPTTSCWARSPWTRSPTRSRSSPSC